MRKATGFTLIELTLVLIIMGLVGLAGTLGLMDAVNGYVRSADTNNMATKAQITLARIAIELTNINFGTNPLAPGNGITASTATSITYDANFGNKNAAQTCCVTTAGNVLTRNGANLTLNGMTLCDRVQDFQLRYYDNFNTAAQTTWGANSRIIEATITLTGATIKGDADPNQVFTARIVPKFR